MASQPVLASEELAVASRASTRRGDRKALSGFTLLFRYSKLLIDLSVTIALARHHMHPRVSKFVSSLPAVSP
jgi:hypothetical protein